MSASIATAVFVHDLTALPGQEERTSLGEELVLFSQRPERIGKNSSIEEQTYDTNVSHVKEKQKWYGRL